MIDESRIIEYEKHTALYSDDEEYRNLYDEKKEIESKLAIIEKKLEDKKNSIRVSVYYNRR